MILKKGQHPRVQFEQERASHLAKKNEADLAYLSMMLDVEIPEGEEDINDKVSED